MKALEHFVAKSTRKLKKREKCRYTTKADLATKTERIQNRKRDKQKGWSENKAGGKMLKLVFED